MADPNTIPYTIKHPIYTQEDPGMLPDMQEDRLDQDVRKLVELYMRRPSALSPQENLSWDDVKGYGGSVPSYMGVATSNPDYDYTPTYNGLESLYMASRIPGAVAPQFYVEQGFHGDTLPTSDRQVSNDSARNTFLSAATALEGRHPGITEEFQRLAALRGHQEAGPGIVAYQDAADRIARAKNKIEIAEPLSPRAKEAEVEYVLAELGAHEAGHKSGRRDFYGNRPGYTGPTHLTNAEKAMEYLYSRFPKGPEYRYLVREIARLKQEYVQPRGPTEAPKIGDDQRNYDRMRLLLDYYLTYGR